jgi:hypothetical protein
MSADSPDRASTIPPGQWIAAIRRADIDLDRKGAMLVFASYADFDDDPETGRIAGEGIHPGTDRYAQDLRMSLATARRYLAWAREVGIIELTRRANRRKKLCDEYRLVLTVDAMELLGIPDPTRYKEQIGDSARARRAASKAARTRRAMPDDDPTPDGPGTGTGRGEDDYRSPKTSANEVDRSNDYRSSWVSANSTGPEYSDQSDYRSPKTSAKTPISAHDDPGLALTQDERTPYIDITTHVFDTDHEIVDLRTKVAVPRARPPHEDQISRDVDTQPAPSAAASGQASPAATRADPPARLPARTGLGFCVTCYAAGQTTLASDPTASFCGYHRRERAAA